MNKILNSTELFKFLSKELLKTEKCQFKPWKSALRWEALVVSHSYHQHSELDFTKRGKNYKQKLKERF